METLFGNNLDLEIESLLYNYCLTVSRTFFDSANQHLTEIFVRETGLKPSKNLRITFSPQHIVPGTLYHNYFVPGTNVISTKLDVLLYVNHNWNPITIYWKSKSAKNPYHYTLCSTDIDPDDIVFWFEKLDTALYYKQLYPGDTLPFKLKELTYVLEVVRLNMDCSIGLRLLKAKVEEAAKLAGQIGDFIERFNLSSEKKNRKDGVVHNSKFHIPEAGILIFEIDLGSAGFKFFKKLLQFLSSQAAYERVIVE